MNATRRVCLTLVLSAAAALSGCFGGGGDDTPPPPPPMTTADPLDAVPASATATVNGALDYLAALTDKPSETREPLD
ncbi:MAG: hypothetical protein JNL93_10115, partial [Pelomonas sp.]|nr:hypothetical protein [Roseateles sp.]